MLLWTTSKILKLGNAVYKDNMLNSRNNIDHILLYRVGS